ncbi:TPA: hypothetical protein G8509_004557 [Salmonella enterica]|uniref:Adhesin n=1 Tax=Salmonella enterica TaxID=28901 RepID=A0A753JP47_SALER|nr:hypothetical protein [Salmonella enterica subsp. enterica serovar Reading]EJC9028476.1 hypothetical protein [Salmonella enterica]HAF7113523.1 hypothetical protein [Salmonella enterica]HAF8192375.1 hypothetical protein [Salmonella enterica]HAF8215696.1 hypothetical protein [Salmonella enterica]
MKIISIFRIWVFILASIIFGNYSHANNLTLSLNIKSDMLNNDTPNEYIIGKGYIKNNKTTFVLIGTDAEKVPGTQSTYIFRGRNNSNNKIFVRLGGEHWISDKNGFGLVANTQNTNSFNLYYLKENTLNPDTYVIDLFVFEIDNNEHS